MTATLSGNLCAFIAGARQRELPDAQRELIKLAFQDTVAVTLAGSREPVVGILRSRLPLRAAESPAASVLFGEVKASPAIAVSINATAGHALDYDDVAFGAHPSVVLVPTIVAVAESIGASGQDMMRAYLTGYEVWAELIGRDADTHHSKGWHPTGVFGTVAAAAVLHRLTQAQCAQALSLAASCSSGLVANFGTMTKPYHAGRAASAGVESVELVLAGLSASTVALEHPLGLLHAISPKGSVNVDARCPGLGHHFDRLGLAFKKYPACYAMHRVIDGAIGLRRDHTLDPTDVQDIEIDIGKTQAQMLVKSRPSTALEARFHLGFVACCALASGSVTLAQLRDRSFEDDAVVQLMGKVRVRTISEVSRFDPIFAPADRIRVRLRDGTTLDSGDIIEATGTARPGRVDFDVGPKFDDCCDYAALPGQRNLAQRFAALDSPHPFTLA